MTRVVKVGGSLFEYAPLRSVLDSWLASQPPAVNILVAGGGQLADAIRRADRRFDIGEARAHWLCVDALSVMARLLAALLPSATWATRLADLEHAASHRHSELLVFDAQDFLRHTDEKLPGSPVPRSWAATSDSIAARLAEVLQASELVLLKSADPPANGSRRAAAAAGYVDEYFPVAAQAIRTVRCVNLPAGNDWTLSDD